MTKIKYVILFLFLSVGLYFFWKIHLLTSHLDIILASSVEPNSKITNLMLEYTGKSENKLRRSIEAAVINPSVLDVFGKNGFFIYAIDTIVFGWFSVQKYTLDEIVSLAIYYSVRGKQLDLLKQIDYSRKLSMNDEKKIRSIVCENKFSCPKLYPINKLSTHKS